MSKRSAMNLDSWLVAGGRRLAAGSPLNVPIVTASNYRIGGELVYSRDDGTPTLLALEELVAGLEAGAEDGHGIAFSSGMAAAAAVLEQVPSGGLLAIPDDCYQGVAGLALAGETKARWMVRRISLDDTDGWKQALAEADLVWLESPSNPLLGVADLPEILAAHRKAGNLVAVDNTFATPINQRPLEIGADVAMHSVTKFLGGHSDLLAGILVTGDRELAARLRRTRTLTGAIPGALECYLAIRGARTMALRLERAQGNAGILAERLADHSRVELVRYPGLETHPTHGVAVRVLDGFGALISFDVAGDGSRADAVCQRVELIQHATSLGGVESTIERRAIIPGQEHLPPSLLRLSVGCEDVEDLWRDLARALAGS